MGNKRIRKKQKKKQMQKPDFFIPGKCCPERADSPELPSPESCLPPEKREEVDKKLQKPIDYYWIWHLVITDPFKKRINGRLTV